jgi:hypothetical protein
MSTQIPTHERQARLTFFLPNIIKMGKKIRKNSNHKAWFNTVTIIQQINIKSNIKLND